MANNGFYALAAPLMLASGSKTRQSLLRPVFPDIAVKPCPDDVEEGLKETYRQAGPATLALRLAEGKALHISRECPGHAVIGADQTCDLGGTLLSKQKTAETALAQLRNMRGRTHYLHSAVAVAREGKIEAAFTETAALSMYDISDAGLIAYIEKETPFFSAGCYLYEGGGRHLFREVKGDIETILGLPVTPLLNALRECKLLVPVCG